MLYTVVVYWAIPQIKFSLSHLRHGANINHLVKQFISHISETLFSQLFLLGFCYPHHLPVIVGKLSWVVNKRILDPEPAHLLIKLDALLYQLVFSRLLLRHLSPPKATFSTASTPLAALGCFHPHTFCSKKIFLPENPTALPVINKVQLCEVPDLCVLYHSPVYLHKFALPDSCNCAIKLHLLALDSIISTIQYKPSPEYTGFDNHVVHHLLRPGVEMSHLRSHKKLHCPSRSYTPSQPLLLHFSREQVFHPFQFHTPDRF